MWPRVVASGNWPKTSRTEPPCLPLGEHGAGQCQEQPVGHASRGRRQTSATLPRRLRLALQPPLCFKNDPRAARHRCNDHPANALPPPQIGGGSMVSGIVIIEPRSEERRVGKECKA